MPVKIAICSFFQNLLCLKDAVIWKDFCGVFFEEGLRPGQRPGPYPEGLFAKNANFFLSFYIHRQIV